MKVIDKQGKYASYKAYKLTEDEQYYLNFEKDVEVLPARYYDSKSNNGKFFFLRKHEPRTPNWEDGGYECSHSLGGIYCFYFDTLILHPRYFKKKRKSTPKTINSPSVKGKKGRPKKDPQDLKTPQVYVPTGRKRGRPRKDPKNLKTPRVYVPTGGKKGRPKKK